MFKNLLVTAALLFTISCSTGGPVSPLKTPEQVYKASYEETWRAVQQSIMPYPLRVNNMDTGQVQTTTIRGNNSFNAPNAEKKSSGYRYKLSFNVLKMSANRTKVSINKQVELARDFISKPEEQSSDGLEEKVLLYRIGREILIERKLVKETLPANN